MRRSASEIINNLEMRIARLEKQAWEQKTVWFMEQLNNFKNFPQAKEIVDFLLKSSTDVGGKFKSLDETPEVYIENEGRELTITFRTQKNEGRARRGMEKLFQEQSTKLLEGKFPALKGASPYEPHPLIRFYTKHWCEPVSMYYESGFHCFLEVNLLFRSQSELEKYTKRLKFKYW